MKIVFEVQKNFPTAREIAQIIWENAILCESLGLLFRVKEIDTHLIKPQPLSKEYITTKVCQYLEIPQNLLSLKTRKREIVEARQISMYFCKQLTKDSLAVIGTHVGGKDHATVLHANKTINNLISTNRKYAQHIEQIEKTLR